MGCVVLGGPPSETGVEVTALNVREERFCSEELTPVGAVVQ